MSWTKIVYKHETKFGKSIVDYEQGIAPTSKDSEKSFIIESILEEFPHYKIDNVEQAVNYCCNNIIPPCPTDAFINCVKLLCEKYAGERDTTFHA
jgi:hypothetical protein